MQTSLFYRFGVALFIGILIGLQRERVSDDIENRELEMFAGIRTFALMGLTGCAAAFVADLFANPLIFLGIFFLLGGLVLVAYYVTAMRGSAGTTTEIAALLTILLGALCYMEQLPLAAALGVVVMALLSLKIELHYLAARVTREDIMAALKFAIITAIVLPVLPNQSFWPAPFDVLNPYKIWLMVVFISGINFLGYMLIKIIGPSRGIGLTGILGGLASSTAVTLSFAQRSQQSHGLAKPFTLAIILSWFVMFVRVLVEVAALNLPLLGVVWPPLAAAGLVTLLYAAYLYFAPRPDETESVSVANPFELGPAIQFGLLYALILLVVRVAEQFFGQTGIYVSSVISGIADVDAITLSMAELGSVGTLTSETAAFAIVLAAMSNTVVKGTIVLAAGTAALRRTILPGIILILLAGLGVALFM